MRSCQMQYECAVWILKLYITSEFSGIKGFLHKTMRSISSNSLIVAFLDEMILYCHLYLARCSEILTYKVHKRVTHGLILLVPWYWFTEPNVSGMDLPYIYVWADRYLPLGSAWCPHHNVERKTDTSFKASTSHMRKLENIQSLQNRFHLSPFY